MPVTRQIRWSGPNHYVELINLVLGVYDKQGNKLLGPVAIGDLWAGFEVPDCTDPSGDPVVLYDQFADGRSSSTTSYDDPTRPFWKLHRGLDDWRPDRDLLPLRVRDGELPVLPGLPEVLGSGPTRT